MGPEHDPEAEITERQKIQTHLENMSFEELQSFKNKISLQLKKSHVTSDKVFKRSNKNRPREMDSKAPFNVKKHVIVTKINEARDPRFEPMVGTFERKTFQENYKFVTDIRKEEKKKLEKQLKLSTVSEERTKIRILLQRLNNQIKESEHRVDLSKKSNLSDSKKMYKKKSVGKLESLVAKYEKLKSTNKIEKHLENKYKKLAKKERKQFNL